MTTEDMLLVRVDRVEDERTDGHTYAVSVPGRPDTRVRFRDNAADYLAAEGVAADVAESKLRAADYLFEIRRRDTLALGDADRMGRDATAGEFVAAMERIGEEIGARVGEGSLTISEAVALRKMAVADSIWLRRSELVGLLAESYEPVASAVRDAAERLVIAAMLKTYRQTKGKKVTE